MHTPCSVDGIFNKALRAHRSEKGIKYNEE